MVKTVVISKKSVLFMVLLCLTTISTYAQNAICSPPTKSKSFNFKLVGTAFKQIWSNAISPCPTGGYWVVGAATTYSNNQECLVAKFNDTGKLLFSKSLGTKFTDQGVSIQSTISGGCFVLINCVEGCNPYCIGSSVLVKMNNAGNIVWSQKTPFLSNSIHNLSDFSDIYIDENSNVFILGNAGSQETNRSTSVALFYDSSGNKKWAKFFQIEGSNFVRRITKRDSIFTIVGDTYYNDSGKYSPLFMQITESGRVNQCFTLNGQFHSNFYDVVVSDHDEIYAVGKVIDTFTNYGGKSYIVKISRNGNILWQKAIGYDDDLRNSIFWDNNKIWISSGSYKLNNEEGGQYVISLDTSSKVLSQVAFFSNNIILNKSSDRRNVVRSHTGGLLFSGFENYQFLSLSFLLTNPCQPSACAFNPLQDPNIKTMNFIKVQKKVDVDAFNGLVNTQLDVLDIPLESTISCNTGCIFNNKSILPKTHELCNNTKDSVILNVQNSDYQYLWSDGDVASTKMILNPGQYWVKTYNKCGARFDTILITSLDPPIFSKIQDSLFCNPLFNHLIEFKSAFKTTIHWENGDTNWIRKFSSPGKFMVSIENKCGVFKDTFIFTQDSAPISKLKKDWSVCEGQSLMIDGSQSNKIKYNYLWEDGNTNPLIEMDTHAIKILKTWNQCGSIIDTIKIKVEKCDCYFYVPNAFSPRGSLSKNDSWKPVFNCPLKDATFSIFSRWGECLVRDQSLDRPWDGTYMGEFVQDGLYIYLIKGSYLDSSQIYRQISKNGVLMVIDGGK